MKNKKINYDFSVEELAKKINYDLQKDSFNIKNALDSNIQKYYKDIEKILQNDNDEQLRYYKYDLRYRHNVASTPKYLKQLLNDINFYDKKFDIKTYLDSINSIESKSVISSIDSIIANLNVKKHRNSIDSNNSNSKLESKTELKKIHAEILQEWKKSINVRLYSWQKSQVKKEQNATIKRVKEYLKAMQKAKEIMQETSEISEMLEEVIMEHLKNGLKSCENLKSFMNYKKESENTQNLEQNSLNTEKQKGYSKGNKNNTLKKQLINFSKIMHILQQDSIKKLCDMLGRLDSANDAIEIRKINTQNYNIKMPTKYANDEFSGLHFSSQLSNILPQEMLLLGDKDFNILFDMKYMENRLLSFEKMGEESIIKNKEITTKQHKKGPIILCIDTSASMSGDSNEISPEIIAKIITLFLTKRARKQGRNCFLINFSESIKTLELSGENGVFGLLEFLSLGFHGGTDCIPALKTALQKCHNENYKSADILMISDFVFDNNDMLTIKKMMQNKDKLIKCNALYVGNVHPIKLKNSPFDNNFFYNPNSKNIESLVKNIRKMGM